MKLSNGFWLPDGDTFFVSRPNYEEQDTQLAMRYVSSYRTAIDVGAHCGFWTSRLADRFDTVIAIEPVLEHYNCLLANTKDKRNVTCLNRAASNIAGEKVSMEVTIENSGMSRVSSTGTFIVDVITIDSLDLTDVDFIKADVEGFEEHVLHGAINTIQQFKPTIVTEILTHNTKPIASILSKYGYSQVARKECNYIWAA